MKKNIIIVLLSVIAISLLLKSVFGGHSDVIDTSEVDTLVERIKSDSIEFSEKIRSLKIRDSIQAGKIDTIYLDRKAKTNEYKKLIDSVISDPFLDSLRRSNRNKGRQRYLKT